MHKICCRITETYNKTINFLTYNFSKKQRVLPEDDLRIEKCRSVLKVLVSNKSLRGLRPLRYSSRDGHAEGEHVNRGRDTPSFCPTLQVLDMCTLVDF